MASKTETDEEWADRMLAIWKEKEESSPYPVVGSLCKPKRNPKRRAIVIYSDSYNVTILFNDSGSKKVYTLEEFNKYWVII